jgi:hypothetical protein
MKDVKYLVEKLTARYETTNPIQLCQALGIHLLQADIQPIKGYYTKSNRIKMITTAYGLSDKEKNIVIAHELGHSILHNDISTTFYHTFTRLNVARIENEANIFAMYLTLKNHEYELEYINNIQVISGITGLDIDLLYRFYR